MKTIKRKSRKSRKTRKYKGGGFFIDYFTKHGKEQRLIDECNKKNIDCTKKNLSITDKEKCDCTVGYGLEKLTSNLYCNPIIINGKQQCSTHNIVKVGTQVNKAQFWYKNLIQPFNWN